MAIMPGAEMSARHGRPAQRLLGAAGAPELALQLRLCALLLRLERIAGLQLRPPRAPVRRLPRCCLGQTRVLNILDSDAGLAGQAVKLAHDSPLLSENHPPAMRAPAHPAPSASRRAVCARRPPCAAPARAWRRSPAGAVSPVRLAVLSDCHNDHSPAHCRARVSQRHLSSHGAACPAVGHPAGTCFAHHS